MKIAAVIILYNPDDDFISNINSYVNFIDKLYIVDNSSKKSLNNFDLLEEEKIEYIFNNENLGIAKSLNMVADLAIKIGYNYLLTMDQDSKFLNFEKYLNCLQNLDFHDIAIVSPNPTYDKNKSTETCEYELVDKTITSGSILNLSLFNKIGKFDENLFIDEVDFDYCLKARMLNYNILLFKNIHLAHSFGTVIENKNNRVQYPPIRVYYITRNRLYMASKYSNFDKKYYGYRRSFYEAVYKKFFRILKHEDNKLLKIKALSRGVFHFLIKRYGKYDV